MAKLPAKVKIGAQTVSLKVVPRDKVDSHGDAHFDYQKGVCHIADDLCKDQRDAALVHESMHMMFRNTGLVNRFALHHEEDIVRTLEPALHAWIKDNPTLIKSIMKG